MGSIMHIIAIVCSLAIIAGVWVYARRKAKQRADAAALVADSAPTVGTAAAGGRQKN
jgi:hypothetical protein